MLIFNTLSPLGHKPVHSQCFWLADKPSMNPFFHLLITRTKASSEIHFWVDQTHNNPKGPDWDYKKDAPAPQSSNTRGCQECGWPVCGCTLSCNNATSIVTIPWHFVQTPGPTESYYNWHCLLLCPCLDSVPEWVHENQYEVSTSLSLLMIEFWTLLWWAMSQVSIPNSGIYSLAYSGISTYPHWQECLNLMAIVMQKTLAECQMVAFVLSYNVFGKTTAEPCIIGRYLAISSIIACRLFRIKAQTSWMLSSVQDLNGCPDLSSVVTLVQPFLKMVNHSYIQQSTVPILCWNSMTDFCPWYTFS